MAASRLLPILILAVVFLYGGAGELVAQRSRTKTAASATGLLKVQIPSGILGDNYWVYVNGRLRSSPPHGTVVSQKLNVVILQDGSGNWEGWGADGLAVSSVRIDQYLRSGDPYGIFRSVEYKVPSGTYTVEIMVPGSRGGAFLRSEKDGLVVRAGTTTEIYAAVPAGFSNMPELFAPLAVSGNYLCPSASKFDITASSDRLLNWGVAYRDHPLRRSLMKAVAAYRTGDRVVMLDVDSGAREYDGQQIKIMLQRFSESPYSRAEVEYCRKLLPQYSSAFDEFEATIAGVRRDLDSFRELADDLTAAGKER